MKKIAIITAIVLTTAVTAFSLTKKENKPANIKIENLALKAIIKTGNQTVATAD